MSHYSPGVIGYSLSFMKSLYALLIDPIGKEICKYIAAFIKVKELSSRR